MKQRLDIFLLLLVIPLFAYATDVVISGEATYYDDGRHSRMECLKIAADQARINALANEFGTIVAQNIIQSEHITNGKEFNNLLTLSATEVRGEWLGDIGEPKFEYAYDSHQNLIVTCKIKGKARPITNEAPEFDTVVLKNGQERNNESSIFTDGDQLYLYFNGSTEGYLMVFLEDETRNVYSLLPYPHESRREIKVKRNREYTFFSLEKGNNEFGQEEEIILTAPDHPEYNKIYVVFSANSFSGPVMKNRHEFSAISSNEFTKWLIRSRRNDNKMGVKIINVEIIPKDWDSKKLL